MKIRDGILAGLLLTMALPGFSRASPSFVQAGNTLVMSNADVRLVYHLTAGTTDFYWNNSEKISAFYSGIGFNTGYVKGTGYRVGVMPWSAAIKRSSRPRGRASPR